MIPIRIKKQDADIVCALLYLLNLFARIWAKPDCYGVNLIASAQVLEGADCEVMVTS